MTAATLFPDTFWGGAAWATLATLTTRAVFELHRCSKGWRR